MTSNRLICCVLLPLIYDLTIADGKTTKNPRGCYAELKCGGKIVSLVRDDENLLFYQINLDRSENLSISVQGLPGLRGPEGSQGNYVPFLCHVKCFLF